MATENETLLLRLLKGISVIDVEVSLGHYILKVMPSEWYGALGGIFYRQKKTYQSKGLQK